MLGGWFDGFKILEDTAPADEVPGYVEKYRAAISRIGFDPGGFARAYAVAIRVSRTRWQVWYVSRSSNTTNIHSATSGKECAEAGSVRAAKTIAMLKKRVCRRVQWLEDEAAGIEAGLEKVRE